MQPYFFPYIGYFQLISDVDEFYLLEDVQFIRHGWIERNKLPKSNGDAFYMKVPLQKHHQSDKIKDIQIDNTTPWKDLLYNQIRSTYGAKKIRNKKVLTHLLDILASDHQSITLLNQHILKKVCSIIGITTKIDVVTPEMYNREFIAKPGDWALEICRNMDAPITYVNPVGGADLFDVGKFKSYSIEIEFLETTSKTIDIQFSIVHLLMSYTDEQISNLLDEYRLIKKRHE